MFVSGHLPGKVCKRIVVRRRNVETLAVWICRIRRCKATLAAGTAFHHRYYFVPPRFPHTQLIERVRGYAFQGSRPLILKRREVLRVAGPFPRRPKNRQDAATIVGRFLVVAKPDRD